LHGHWFISRQVSRVAHLVHCTEINQMSADIYTQMAQLNPDSVDGLLFLHGLSNE